MIRQDIFSQQSKKLKNYVCINDNSYAAATARSGCDSFWSSLQHIPDQSSSYFARLAAGSNTRVLGAGEVALKLQDVVLLAQIRCKEQYTELIQVQTERNAEVVPHMIPGLLHTF